MHNKRVWEPISVRTLLISESKNLINSCMVLKEKFSDTVELKTRLVAGEHMQDRSTYSDNDAKAPIVSLLSVYMIASFADHESRNVVAAEITGVSTTTLKLK